LSDSETCTLEVKGLLQLLKAFKERPPVARVGILGTTSRKSDKGQSPTNAEIGAIYEFNDGSHPGGSFLRVPISDNLQKSMEEADALSEDSIKEVIRQGSTLPWLRKVAGLAEGIVIGAFASGGYGKWRPSNMAHKKVQQTLVETRQLSSSITSEVKAS